MKKILFTLIALTCIMGNAVPQTQDTCAHGSEAQKILTRKRHDFFVKKLQLTNDEEKVLFPVLQQFDTKKRNIIKERHSILRKFEQNMMTISDNEAKKIAENLLELQKKEYEMDIEYKKIFESILPIKKSIMLYKVQNEFRRALLNSICSVSNKQKSNISEK